VIPERKESLAIDSNPKHRESVEKIMKVFKREHNFTRISGSPTVSSELYLAPRVNNAA
jgi:hypothetical protein